MWHKKESIDALESELSKIVSPFKKKENSFYLYAKVGERELDFSGISEEIFQMASDKYNFSLNKDNIIIKGQYNIGFFHNKKIEMDIREDHIKEFYEKYKEKLLDYKFNCNDNYCLKFKQIINLDDVGDIIVDEINNKLVHPGNFSGEIFSYYLEPNYIRNKFKTINFEYFEEASQIGKYIESHKGIKIFRDDFRIMPYGEGKHGDWLGLSTDQGKTGKFIDLKNDNIVGYVELTGENNYLLYEKTNREGFVENNFYYNFETIMKIIIKRINKSRRLLSDQFREYVNELITENSENTNVPSHVAAAKKVEKITNEANNVEQKLNNLNEKVTNARVILSDSFNKINESNISINEKSGINQNFNELKNSLRDAEITINESKAIFDDIEDLNNQIKVIEDDYNVINTQVESITELAGLGMVAETLTHELYTIINNLRSNTEQIKEYFKVNFGDDKKINRYFNFVSFSSESIRKQVSHLAPSFKNVRTVKNRIDIVELLEVHKGIYFERAQRKKINFKVINKGNTFCINANEGMLLQVFDNLYINSEYWLEHTEKLGYINHSEFIIDIQGNGIIHIWDNGIGIDQSIERHIFEPFVSNKKDGRGLGLYIISKLLSYHKSSIRLLRDKNEFGNLYKFEIDLSQCLIWGDQ